MNRPVNTASREPVSPKTPAGGPTCHLTSRDLAILSFVFAYGGCTADHLRRRFFPTPGARSACYTRLARLTDAGFLRRTRLPSLTGVGSGKALATLGPAGRPIVAERFGLSRSELQRAGESVTPWVAAHHFAICDVRLSLEIAAEQRNVRVDWTAERELRREPLRIPDPTAKSATIVLVPDGAFSLVTMSGAEQWCWFELDQGTVPPKRLRAKLRGYLEHARSEPAPVLFVVPDLTRQAAIIRWAQEEAQKLGADPTIFWLTTTDRIRPETILAAPIWEVAGGPTAHALLESEPHAAQPLSSGQLIFAKGAAG